MASDLDGNFLERFKDGDAALPDNELDDEVVAAGAGAPRGRAQQALQGSLQKPKCEECGKEDGPAGGGRYGFDDHEGLFYCGRCWMGWDLAEQEKIKRPAYLQMSSKSAASSSGNGAASSSGGVDGGSKEARNFFEDFPDPGEGTDDIEVALDAGAGGAGPRQVRQALPASVKPKCEACGKEDGPSGGGRYGFDDHEGLFYCGRCWMGWDEAEQEKIKRPAYLQMASKGAASSSRAGDGGLDDDARNFFDDFPDPGEGTDDIDGAWDPSQGRRGDGAQALPGSWDKPTCEQCGLEEGDEGGGRYRAEAEGYKFFCGRCWKSWDAEARAQMMRAYAPSGGPEPYCPAPVVHCPPPDAPDCDLPDDWLLDEGFDGQADFEIDEGGLEGYEAGPRSQKDFPEGFEDVEAAEAEFLAAHSEDVWRPPSSAAESAPPEREEHASSREARAREAERDEQWHGSRAAVGGSSGDAPGAGGWGKGGGSSWSTAQQGNAWSGQQKPYSGYSGYSTNQAWRSGYGPPPDS